MVQSGLFFGICSKLSLHPSHSGDHGVDVAKDILLRGSAGDGCRRGVLEQRLECRSVLFDGEMSRSEVFAEQFVREAEKWLVLLPVGRVLAIMFEEHADGDDEAGS